jgi:Flp pilus assembly protein TadG
MKILFKFRSRQLEKGQMILAFIVLVPVFVICLFIVTDMGRMLALKNQVRIAADSASLAAAGALDIKEATLNRNFVINKNWARERAEDAIATIKWKQGDDDTWMHYRLAAIDVDRDKVTVVVEGWGNTIFGGYLGINTFTARAVSNARVAVGVDTEW